MAEIRYDVATALCQGQRCHQEDALAQDFPIGAGSGFVVLSDGMGGHAAGAIASRIAVTEVFAELMFQRGDSGRLQGEVPGALHTAAMAANHCILAHAGAKPETTGMGATLVVPVFDGPDLYWISIGDSPLYLYRNGSLRQVNEDHSLAPQIDLMVQQGLMDPEFGATHPERNCLTSALGGPDIARIDCPEEPLPLCDGDIVVAASDGVLTLREDRITALLTEMERRPAAEIARRCMDEIKAAGDPDQDNTSLCIVRIEDLEAPRGLRPWAMRRLERMSAKAPAKEETQGMAARVLQILHRGWAPARES